MIVSIDYDNTFSADPTTWADVIRALLLAGHRVICVTGRGDDPTWGPPVRTAFAEQDLAHIPIVFAALRWKADAAKAAGWDVDIWIDDSPEAVRLPNARALHMALETDSRRAAYAQRIMYEE